MKQIIRDQLRRRWLFLILFCLTYFSFGLLFTNHKDSSSYFIFFIFWLTFVLGPNVWLSELRQDYARIALALPLTAKEIGRAFWWLSVGIAVLLIAVSSFIGFITMKLCHSTNESGVDFWLLYVAINAVLYAAIFWLFSGKPGNPSFFRKMKYTSQLSDVFWWIGLIGGGYYLFTSGLDSDIKLALYFLVCTPLAILGWLRAEHMIAEFGEYRPTAHPPQNARKQFTPPSGNGGTAYLLQNSFIHVWFTGFLMLVAVNVFGVFENRPFDWHHLTRNLTGSLAFFVFFFVFILRSTFLILNIRFLRTTPISTGRLAAVLLGEAILPLLTLFLAITALAWHETGSVECLSLFKLEFLVAASAGVFIAVTIWNTSANFIKASALVIVILATLAPAFYQLIHMDGRGLPFWFVFGFTVVVLAGAHWATSQILARSSSAYRSRQSSRQNMLGNRWKWGR